MTDPGRAALIRYLGDCIRAELRARQLHAARQQRVREALQQISEYDAASVPTADQMLAGARAAKRRNSARRSVR